MSTFFLFFIRNFPVFRLLKTGDHGWKTEFTGVCVGCVGRVGRVGRVGLFIFFGAKTTDKPLSWARLECPGTSPLQVRAEAEKPLKQAV